MDDFERQFPTLFRRAYGVAFVVVGVSHGGRLTLVSSVDGTAHDLTGFEPGAVLTLDWAR